MADGGHTVPRIVKSEHIGPDDTGDNIEAKRVVLYVWDGVSAWARMTQPGAASGGLTDAELRATPVPVSGTVDLGATDNAVLDAVDTNTGNTATNTTDLPNVIGTDGAAGPTKAISVGGTRTTGELEEIRVDADGHLQIDVLTMPAGGSGLTDSELRATPVPVSGTVAATQSGTWTEANSAAIKTAVEIIDNAISGSEMQVDVITMPAITANATDYALEAQADATYDYFAFAPAGTSLASAAWKAKRVEGDGTTKWADGNTNFDNVATDLTALSYS